MPPESPTNPATDHAADVKRRLDLLLAIGALNCAAIIESSAQHVGQVAHTLQWSGPSDAAFDLAVRARNMAEELHELMLRTFGPDAVAPPEPPAFPGAPKVWTPGGAV